MVTATVALAASRAGAQPLATASSATLLHTQTQRTRLESLIPHLSAPRLLNNASAGSLLYTQARVSIDVPLHEAAPPSPFVSFRNNFAAQYFRMNPIDGWTWAGLGLGTASLGFASIFLQLAGASVPTYLPRLPGVTTAENPVMLSVGAYALSYQTVGSLTMNAGVSALSSNLLRLVFAPRDRRVERYMRTFATELQGGWLFGVEGAI
jgi:hypothetical protein